MKETIFHVNHQQSPEQSIFIVNIGQGFTRAGDCIVKIGTGLTGQRGYLAGGGKRTRIKVSTCRCHANPCTEHHAGEVGGKREAFSHRRIQKTVPPKMAALASKVQRCLGKQGVGRLRFIICHRVVLFGQAWSKYIRNI